MYEFLIRFPSDIIITPGTVVVEENFKYPYSCITGFI